MFSKGKSGFITNSNEKENCITTFVNFFLAQKTNIKKKLIVQILGENTAYPTPNHVVSSLQSISIKSELLRNLDYDFISSQVSPQVAVFIQEKKLNYVLILKATSDEITIVDPKDGIVNLHKHEFLQRWTNAIVKCTPDPTFDYSRFQRPSIIFSSEILLLFALLLLSQFVFIWKEIVGSPQLIVPFIGETMGVVFSFLMLIRDNKISVGLIDKLCEINEKFDCRSVSNSKLGKLFTVVKLYDIAGVFFVFGMLICLLPSSFITLSEKISIINFFALLGLPVAIYLTIYQSFILKKYCFFCLCISCVIVIESISAGFNPTFIIFKRSIIFIAAILLQSIIVWLLVHKLIKSENALIKAFSNNITSNQFDFFVFLLMRQKKIKVEEFKYECRLGNNSSPIALTLITDPLCNNCKKTYFEVQELFKMYPNEISITYKFPANNYQVTKILLSQISTQNGTKVLDSIYHGKKQENENRLSEMEDKDLIKEVDLLLAKHNKWCADNGLRATPAILLNGYLFPATFQILDLRVYLDRIIAEKALFNDH